MKTKTLNKNIRRSITGSFGRFISIFSLMALGVFAFVGLKMSGPNMRATAEEFYARHHLADLSITSTMGLNASDQALIRQENGLKTVDFGYFRDVLLPDKKTSLRIFSQADNLSTYELIAGEMPQKSNEVALDFLYQDKYKLGDTIRVTEEKNEGSYLLKNHEFKLVGFVKSSEFVDKSLYGPTNIGTGQLNGYAVVPPEAFQSDVYMIARLSFKTMQGLSPYDPKFTERSDYYEQTLKKLLERQPEKRLAEIKEEPLAQLNQAQDKLKAEEIRLQESQNVLDQQKALAGENPQLQALQESLNTGKAKLVESKTQLQEQRDKLAALEAPEYTVNNRKEGNPGYQTFVDNSTRIDALSNIFPVVLFAIAVLVSLTTMTRFVEEERGNMGLLKALGYTNAQIRKKFIVYGTVSACAGATVGVILGHVVLPHVVFNAYSASSTFSGLILTFSPFWTLVSFVIALACTVFPAYLVAQSELRGAPAALFLAKPPKAGSRIFLERIKPIWKRMSFTYKVTARNLFRYKQRMLMTIVGVAGCTALLVMGFGIRDSISGLSQRQFGEILHYNMLAVSQDNLNKQEQDELEQFLQSDNIKSYAPVHFEQLHQTINDNRQDISLMVPEKEENFNQFVTLRNRVSKEKLSLPKEGAVVSEKLAELLGAKVGQTISLKTNQDKIVKIKVAGITEMYMGHYIFMSQNQYKGLFDAPIKTNAHLLKLRDTSKAKSQAASADFMRNAGALTVSQNSDLQNTIDAFLHGINSVMFVLIGCAILLAIVVIYNLTNINVSERIRELSTIKVLGFYDREVTLYIYRETILLSFMGILAGFGLGAYFHHVIITMLPTDMIMFNPNLLWSNLLLSTLITLATTLGLSIVVHLKLKNVDMLGALKSVD
ncbi:FtsX-like permease family protein [Lactococcus formosensis]|uniref:FtsX-like permease family protein n=1 Tax=Lactococcus formosensis TaxID=1281486 RepID=A0A9X4SFK6_9LACT|nr:FtsX-like permease family protein [Lactococcus formosensis]MDG6126518.1 FtsX-like permease family protein [Lactococcus formosensis]MDG6131794.1 FtsX-like permease family protein [Lactococcus formosensis]MDG6133791.1 FtsX-like permease family protein [Lactococcus formosensis]MDG6140583.1 FtsX-like permease family protein [Lactococcus formosensis]MDG6145842.1 FtsX-like permease family protein [Lactococcus formosensis]